MKAQKQISPLAEEMGGGVDWGAVERMGDHMANLINRLVNRTPIPVCPICDSCICDEDHE